MQEPNFFRDCFLCNNRFQFGPHVYNGRSILTWDIMVCRQCYASNWDGLVPEQYPHLIEHLQKKGCEIKLNSRGLLDWPQ